MTQSGHSLGRLSHATGTHLGAATLSVERLRSNEDTTYVIDVGARVVRIACDLFNKLAIGFEDLVIGDINPNPICMISQRRVGHPAKHRASLVRHPELHAHLRWCNRPSSASGASLWSSYSLIDAAPP